MSEAETGFVISRENVSPGQQQVMMRNSTDMNLTFPDDADYKKVAVGVLPFPYQSLGNGSGEASSSVQGGGMVNMNMVGTGDGKEKKKRGRPRKYGPDGNMSLSLDSAAPVSAERVFSPSPSGGSLSPSLGKRRGRPPGSGRKQQVYTSGATGSKFTTHIIDVGANEHGPRAICILSANGCVSSVTLGQPNTSGTASYEGPFEIMSLSGSFLLMENDGQPRRSGGLSVSLAGSDGQIIGGRVAGALVTANPVQIIVGSFIAEGSKEARVPYPREPMPAPTTAATGASSPSRGTISESSDGPASPRSTNPLVMPWK